MTSFSASCVVLLMSPLSAWRFVLCRVSSRRGSSVLMARKVAGTLFRRGLELVEAADDFGAEVGELDYGGDKAHNGDSLRQSFEQAVVDFCAPSLTFRS